MQKEVTIYFDDMYTGLIAWLASAGISYILTESTTVVVVVSLCWIAIAILLRRRKLVLAEFSMRHYSIFRKPNTYQYTDINEVHIKQVYSGRYMAIFFKLDIADRSTCDRK